MLESKLKHLEFIQNLIARFNNNSFVIKGWSVTLVAALFALAAKDANERYMFVTYVSTIIFWLLDSYYLSKERQFRCLYSKIAALNDTDFTMDSSQYDRGRNTWFRSLFAQSIIFFYGFLAILPILLLLVFNK